MHIFQNIQANSKQQWDRTDSKSYSFFGVVLRMKTRTDPGSDQKIIVSCTPNDTALLSKQRGTGNGILSPTHVLIFYYGVLKNGAELSDGDGGPIDAGRPVWSPSATV